MADGLTALRIERLVQLLGRDQAAKADSFSVQAVLDDDLAAILPGSTTPEGLRAWERRRLTRLTRPARQALEEAVKLLRALERDNKARRDVIVQRHLHALREARPELQAELAKAISGRYVRNPRLVSIWPVHHRSDTLFLGDLSYQAAKQWRAGGVGDEVVVIHGRPIWISWHQVNEAVLLQRLDWTTSQLRFDERPRRVSESKLERILRVVRTISELVLLLTGVGQLVAVARVRAVLAVAAGRASHSASARAAAVARWGATRPPPAGAVTPVLGVGEAAGGRVAEAGRQLTGAVDDLGRGLAGRVADAERGTAAAARGTTPAGRGTAAVTRGTGRARTGGTAASGQPGSVVRAGQPLHDPAFVQAQVALVQARIKQPVAAASLGRLGTVNTRHGFRSALEARLIAEPQHELGFLLQGGKLRTSTGRGIDQEVWANMPEIIEAGHAVSAKSLTGAAAGSDRFMVMSAHYNRLFSATIEHSRKGAWMEMPYAIEIRGIPVHAETAMEWVAKELMSPEVLAAGRTVIY